MQNALIILSDQLFPLSFYRPHRNKKILMVEDQKFLTRYRFHKHKLLLTLASMRNMADELKREGFEVHYRELSEDSLTEQLSSFLADQNIQKVFVPEITEKNLEHGLLSFFEEKKIEFEVLESPMFLGTRQDFKNYLFYNPKPFMKTFYERERKRLGILIDAQRKPLGGHWSFDLVNRKKAPKVLTNREPLLLADDQYLESLKILVEEKFPQHPGMVENFWLPVNHADALKWLNHFVDHHLKDFGAYQDALTERDPFLYHSLLSPLLNIGLLTPQMVLKKALDKYEQGKIPLASVEGFIRQLLWRDFCRGIYQFFSEEEEKLNYWNHHRQLTQDWYEGTTGLPAVDDAIHKANDYGYCHSIERLMVLSNVMLLSEIHPLEAHRWFMEMFVDSAEWITGPNVFGMGLFSDGGIFATKPYISGSNYILKMSDYKRGEWCDTWDGLFWRFIGKHQAFISKQPRLALMNKALSQMESSKKERVLGAAEAFLIRKTLEIPIKLTA